MNLHVPTNGIENTQLSGVREGIFEDCQRGHGKLCALKTSRKIKALVESRGFSAAFGQFLSPEQGRSDEVRFSIELSYRHITVIKDDGRSKTKALTSLNYTTSKKSKDVVDTAMRIYNECLNQCHSRASSRSSSMDSTEQPASPQYLSSEQITLTPDSSPAEVQTDSATQEESLKQISTLTTQLQEAERGLLATREALFRNQIESEYFKSTIENQVNSAQESLRKKPSEESIGIPLQAAIKTQAIQDVVEQETISRQKIENETETELFMAAAEEEIALIKLAFQTAKKQLKIQETIQKEFKQAALEALEIQQRQIERLRLELKIREEEKARAIRTGVVHEHNYDELQKLHKQLLDTHAAKTAEDQIRINELNGKVQRIVTLLEEKTVSDKATQTDLEVKNTEIAQVGITSEHPSLDDLVTPADPLEGLAKSSALLDTTKKIRFTVPRKYTSLERQYLEMVRAQMLLNTTPVFEGENYKFLLNSSEQTYSSNPFITHFPSTNPDLTGLFPKANKCTTALFRNYATIAKALHTRRKGDTLKTLPAYLNYAYITSFNSEKIKEIKNQVDALLEFQNSVHSEDQINSFLTDKIFPLFNGNPAQTILEIELAYTKTKKPTEELQKLHSAAQQLKSVLKQVLACMEFTEEKVSRKPRS